MEEGTGNDGNDDGNDDLNRNSNRGAEHLAAVAEYDCEHMEFTAIHCFVSTGEPNTMQFVVFHCCSSQCQTSASCSDHICMFSICCCFQYIHIETMTSSVFDDVPSMWMLDTECLTEPDGGAGCVLF